MSIFSPFRVFVVLSISLLAVGCSFENPLSGPTENLNTWLLGKWRHKDEKGNVYEASVLPHARDRMAISFQSFNKSGRVTKEWQFEGWISRVGDNSFLVLHCLKSAGEVSEGSYVFAHSQVMDQMNVILRPLQLESASDTSGYHLRREVRQRQKDKTLLPQTGSKWTRIADADWPRDDQGQNRFFPPRFPENPPSDPLEANPQ